MFEKVKPYTMTSKERIAALVASTKLIIENDIPGDFVECGVWKGGSSMAIAYTLLELGVTDRFIYLFDTFSGMPRPRNDEYDLDGNSALEIFQNSQTSEDSCTFCEASVDEVGHNMLLTGYDANHIVITKGKVEHTLPHMAPEEIALLRLDTDWYDSTKHELEHLYPKVSKGGILIIDDYGHWSGAKKAVDEYFENPDLHTIDYTGRLLIKP